MPAAHQGQHGQPLGAHELALVHLGLCRPRQEGHHILRASNHNQRFRLGRSNRVMWCLPPRKVTTSCKWRQSGSRAAAKLCKRMHQAVRERQPKLSKQAWPTHVARATKRRHGGMPACTPHLGLLRLGGGGAVIVLHATAQGGGEGKRPDAFASSSSQPLEKHRRRRAPPRCQQCARATRVGAAAASTQSRWRESTAGGGRDAAAGASLVVEHLGHGDGAAGEVGVVVQALAHLHRQTASSDA